MITLIEPGVVNTSLLHTRAHVLCNRDIADKSRQVSARGKRGHREINARLARGNLITETGKGTERAGNPVESDERAEKSNEMGR